MFAIAALLCFAISLFHGHIGDINLVTLGLAFMALAMIFSWNPVGAWLNRNRQP
jgi:hypothetical protein